MNTEPLCPGGVFASIGLSLWALVGCAGTDAQTRPVELEFEARFGTEPVSCTAPIAQLGESRVTGRLLDFRLFVHDVELVRANGEHVAFNLSDDGVWQREGVALLDFEDGTGSCETGSADTHFSLHGAPPNFGDYVGVAFTVGVPERLNHLDAATAPAPLNVPGLWWSWQGGYKYVRVDIATDEHPGGFFFHLGGTHCDGAPSDGFACQRANLARIELASNSLGRVALDAQALYRNLNLSVREESESDLVPGCMASPGDPECPAMFGALGLAFEREGAAPPEQTLFELR